MKLGLYDNLNESDPPKVPITMRSLAEMVVGMNYGQHRLISELIRVRDEKYDPSWTDDVYESHRRQTQMLRDLLESGFF